MQLAWTKGKSRIEPGFGFLYDAAQSAAFLSSFQGERLRKYTVNIISGGIYCGETKTGVKYGGIVLLTDAGGNDHGRE